MRQNFIPKIEWDSMNDLEKIESVVNAAKSSNAADRPSYAYMTAFLEDVHQSFSEEVSLRKTLSKHNLWLLIILYLIAVPSLIGIIEMVGLVQR